MIYSEGLVGFQDVGRSTRCVLLLDALDGPAVEQAEVLDPNLQLANLNDRFGRLL